MRTLITTVSLLIIPFSAVRAQPPTDLSSLLGLFNRFIDILIPIIFSLTFIVFFWGITKAWILHGGNEKEVDAGKKLAVVGIIVLAIMFSIWGILKLLRYSLFGVV